MFKGRFMTAMTTNVLKKLQKTKHGLNKKTSNFIVRDDDKTFIRLNFIFIIFYAPFGLSKEVFLWTN